MHTNVVDFQSYAKTAIANEIDDAWTNIHGIHDNGPRDHGVWRLTLTAYWQKKKKKKKVVLEPLVSPDLAIYIFKQGDS